MYDRTTIQAVTVIGTLGVLGAVLAWAGLGWSCGIDQMVNGTSSSCSDAWLLPGLILAGAGVLVFLILATDRRSSRDKDDE